MLILNNSGILKYTFLLMNQVFTTQYIKGLWAFIAAKRYFSIKKGLFLRDYIRFFLSVSNRT